MNILILSPFLPYPIDQGGKIRIFNIIKNLSKNHAITLATVTHGSLSEYESLSKLCDEVIIVKRPPKKWGDRFSFLLSAEPYNYIIYYSDELKLELRRLLSRKSFDLVQIEFPMMWQYADIFKGMPVILDAHNIEHEIIRQVKYGYSSLMRKILYVMEEIKIKRKEKRAWRECALCFTVSKKERDLIAAYHGHNEKVFTISNGVDLETHTFLPKSETEGRLLFLGGMDYQPNLDSALYLLKEIFPSVRSGNHAVRLDFVARDVWRINIPMPVVGVEFHENVPDVLPYFRRSDILLVPLRYGGGTRIKILEAMAAGLPVVTTSKGCEGIEAMHGVHLMIADSPDEFAAYIKRVLEDAELRRTITQQARSLVEERYSWKDLVNEMTKTYRTI